MASRDANYIIQRKALLEEKQILLDKYSHVLLRSNLRSQKNNDLTQEELRGLQAYEDIEWKIECLEQDKSCPIKIQFKPIISVISSVEKTEDCSFSVRTIVRQIISVFFSVKQTEHSSFSVRKKLHQLRQKVEKKRLAANLLESFEYHDTQNSQAVKQYLEKYPKGIELLFTDQHKAFLVYDKASQVTTYKITK